MKRALILAIAAGVAGALLVASATAQEEKNRGVGVRRNPPAVKEPSWASQARQRLTNASSAMKVQLVTHADKRVFRAGDLVRYELTTDTAGFLYLIVFSEQNVATCIFPNAHDKENRVAAGTVRLPRNESYSFPVGEPFGKDLAVAVVATQPLLFESGRVDYSWEEVFERLRSPALAADIQREFGTRGVGVTARNDWQAATVVIETRPR